MTTSSPTPPRRRTASVASSNGSSLEGQGIAGFGAIDAEPTSGPASMRRDQLVSMVFSTIVHVALAVLFACIVFRTSQRTGRAAIVSTLVEATPDQPLTSSAVDSASSGGATDGVAVARVSVAAVGDELAEPSAMTTQAAPAAAIRRDTVLDGHETDVIGAVRTAEEAEISGEIAADTMTELAGVADVLAGEVMRHAQFSDVVVIWMLDRSLSMRRQHQLLADELMPFFKNSDALEKTGHRVLHSAVGFGAAVEEIRKPSTNGLAVASALQRGPGDDASGFENICQAIGWTVIDYRENRKRYRNHQLLMFVLTDESGDDTEALNETIAICRAGNCRVTVVGPSASLGTERGLHQYRSQAGDLYHLPVTRGPDTPDRHRAFLPRWKPRYTMRENSSVGGYSEETPKAWEGGPNLLGISSGLPVYGLSRLTAETGGRYVVFDRPNDRPPYDMARLQEFLPVDADALDESSRRVRAAVQQTISDVSAATPQLTPRFEFGSSAANGPSAHPVLIQQLKDARAQGVLMGKVIGKIKDNAMAAVTPADLEDCCPRWRASYDLLVAQLFEMTSRTEDYVRAIDAVGKLNKTTNRVDLAKPSLTRVSTPAQQEAVDRLAKVASDYAGTPWGHLAELERQAMHTIESFQYRALPQSRSSGTEPPLPTPPRL